MSANRGENPNTVTFVNSHTDRLVEVSDAFAALVLGFNPIGRGMFSDYHVHLALSGGTTVALEGM